MLSILCVRLTIKVKVGIPESFKVGWYPPKKTGSSHLMFNLLIRPLNFTQNDLSATLDKNTNFNISKNLLRKGGISNSLYSRTV